MDSEIGLILIATDDPALYAILFRFILGKAGGRQRKHKRHHEYHSSELTQHTTSSFSHLWSATAWRARIDWPRENNNKNLVPPPSRGCTVERTLCSGYFPKITVLAKCELAAM
jgi:hypothetical protein